jgi:hypothetical protein
MSAHFTRRYLVRQLISMESRSVAASLPITDHKVWGLPADGASRIARHAHADLAQISSNIDIGKGSPVYCCSMLSVRM